MFETQGLNHLQLYLCFYVTINPTEKICDTIKLQKKSYLHYEPTHAQMHAVGILKRIHLLLRPQYMHSGEVMQL